jgi:hypothetical protein
MNKNYRKAIASAGVAVAMVATAALPAFAQTAGLGLGVNASASASVAGIKVGAAVGATLAARIKDITTRADAEITRRINALNALAGRINEMTRLSATDKTNLSTSIAGQVTAMNTLQAQITADAAANNTSSLKTDVQSIASSYRIFILVLPQGSIEAASDRVLTIVGTMNDLSAKFSTRISAAQAAGNDVTAANASLADMNAKVSDANTQATAAASEVVSLTPDNGNATIEASNTAALKDAHSKILAAQQDFLTARADALAIIQDLAGFKVSVGAAATATAE